MAANSGGVEWASIVKPILAASYGSFNKSDILELVKAINRSEHELLNHEDEYETFYTAFAALAADYISSSASTLCKSQVGVVCQACRILLQYLLSHLQAHSTGEAVATTGAMLFPKQLLLPIRALCSAEGMLQRADQISLTAIMKNAKLPAHIKTSTPGEKEVPVKEPKRSRSDLSASILEQLTTPLHDFVIPRPQLPESSDLSANKTGESNNLSTGGDPGQDTKNLFIQKNVASLQALRAGDILIDMCLNLPHLTRYIHKYRDAVAKKGFSLPASHSEATLVRHSLQALVNDISLTWSALSLPVLEPLTPDKLEKLCVLTMSCLYCAVSNATASSLLGISSAISPKCTGTTSGTAAGKGGEDEGGADSHAITVVEKALEIFSLVSGVIKTSTRAGGHILQNHLLIGVWVLITGLQTQLSASSFLAADKGKDDKGKSPNKLREGSSRINLMKVQQGFGVLSVALASQALTMMSALLDDLQVETACCEDSMTQGPEAELEPASLDILGQFTALQRAAKFLAAAPLNQLLFYLATISYRKACTLKRIQKHPPEGDTFSTSDSTTYYEDDFSCSDESSADDDDDSEPILGLWFEETLAPPETPPGNHVSQSAADSQEGTGKHNTDRTGSIVPEKGEPHGYILLASQIFQFMNKHLLSSESPFMLRYVQAGLAEQQMVILAAIIRDLDRETARTETGTISVYFGAVLGNLYSEFSQALTRYTHNLLARNILTESLQGTLLNHLGVSPWSQDNSNTWPLQVYPRTLAVLAQVLLLKPQQEKEAACISIWHRLVNTLVENVCNPPTTFEVENEDLNVEHAQLLLFLFHALNLMQKKSVLLLTAGGVIRCSEIVNQPMRDSQLLHLSRLLLLLEYLMKHLYDAPPALLEQVQWNLFSATSMVGDTSENKDGSRMASRIYCPWKEIEDNYRKFGPQDEFSMKPRFYSLTVAEINNQDTPKLDGLACNFILGTPDKLKYPLLIDALIEILNVTTQCNPSIKRGEKLSFTGLCTIQYCFTICWRLLLLLPPSTPYMDKLSENQEITCRSMLLHSLVWGPRSAYKTFTGWMKDCLVKQGMYTQYAETLLKNVAKTVNNLKYDIGIAKNCITAFHPQVQKSDSLVPKANLPQLSDLYLLDAVIAKIQVLMDEGISKPTTESSDSTKSSQTTDASPSANDLAQELLPHVLTLTETIIACSRSSLLYQMNESSEPVGKYSLQDFQAFKEILAISSSRCNKTNNLATALMALLPAGVRTVLEKWNDNGVADFPWNTYANDVIPAESYVLAVINTHISSLSNHGSFSVNPSLKYLLHSLVTFIGEHITKCAEDNEVRHRAVDVLVPLTLDACTEHLHDAVLRTLERVIGDPETDEHQKRVYYIVLEHTYYLLRMFTAQTTTQYFVAVDEKVLLECIKFMETLLDKAAGRLALDQFFNQETGRDLVTVLLSVATPQGSLSTQYSTKVLHFFNKLFSTAEKTPGDGSLERLCGSLSRLATVEPAILQNWLRHVILGGPTPPPANLPTPTTTTTLVPASPQQSESPTNAATPTGGAAAPPPPPVTATTNGKSETGAQIASSESNSSTHSPTEEHQGLLQENHLLLQGLTAYIVKENSNVSEEVAVTILRALIPIGSHILSPAVEGTGFSELMVVMATLADAGSGKGHIHLFSAATEWLELCKQYLSQPAVVEKLEAGVSTGKHRLMLDSACYLLNYVGDVVAALCPSPPGRATSPPWEGELPPELDSDWTDDLGHEDDESGGEDSDEDSLCNKLCTFTITQREFMNQHWYHCHTCKMVDGVGVCTVCARVCHRGHDITYAKYGNFFCDCGAKDDGTCQALVKRSPQSSEQHITQALSTSTPGTFGMEQMLPSSLRRRPSSPVNIDASERGTRDRQRLANLAKQLESSREILMSHISNSSVVASLLDLVKILMPAVETSCKRHSPVGCHQRAQTALRQLHTLEKHFENTDQLMVPTLGSQEGAFENVRMNYSGDQGQTIRQLLSAHMIRRVAMCCLSSPHGKRQHLAVSHEKGKITVLQLSALLKQADSSKRKLTLTRLASAPIPFTVLSITGNQWNEDFLAVCGLKDCHVLTFSSSGSVADHLVLHPQLETGNFIIRALWLPGSQTQLALVTADFVKIYDLSHDALSPQYFFLVPSGKIRDCTFVCTEDGSSHMLLMSSAGHIYSQAMDEESSAKHGPFYVTNTLEVYHSEIKDVNGQVGGGGVSIYYSHALQLLFFSYSHGKSFIAPLKYMDSGLPAVFMINLGKAGGNGNKANNAQPQPLCQWSEVPNHPGLVCSVMQSSNNPVILMLKPDTVLVQEIKVVPAKAKIMDMVAIRHPSSNADHRTTLILLCEDGSLRIYMAAMEQTGFWLSPNVQAVSTMTAMKPLRKKKVTKTGKPPGMVTFPIDFFEHCQAMNEVEFGGNDLLQIYNTQQIKHRLNTTGMYVVSTKPAGFSIEITNNDTSLVMTGVRIMLGTQDSQRAPSYVEVFGRSIQTNVARNRWFDMPFTREESLQADKKLILTFGPSQDPEGVTMVDSIKVYGKTKDAFGWPEETEDLASTSAAATQTAAGTSTETDNVAVAPVQLTSLDRMISGVLEVLDGCFTLFGSATTDENKVAQRSTAVDVATQLLTLPTPVCVQLHTKCLLAALHPTRTAYHSYKDQALLNHIHQSLAALREVQDPRDLDAEAFYRLVLTARGVAVARPYNLAKFADQQDKTPVSEESPAEITDTEKKSPSIKLEPGEGGRHLMVQLMEAMWLLHQAHPANMALAPVCVPGLTHVEATVHAIVEIIHAFTTCDMEGTVGMAAKLYLQLLLSEDTSVSFSAKQAIIRVLRPRLRRRRVLIPSPPHCSTPGGATELESEKGPVSQPSQDSTEEQHYEVDSVEPMVLLAPDAGAGASGVSVNVNPIEALLGAPGAFPPLLDIPPDADDETMVELAIALSLQDHEGGADLQVLQQGLQQGLQGLANLQGLQNLSGQALQSLQVLASQGLAQVQNQAQAQEAGHYSDTTASAGGSDDEGSTAATDGSTLRTSPAEQGGSAGSESGGSGVDSITGEHNVSGRSSAYGDNMQEPLVGARSETSSLGAPAGFQTQDPDGLEPEPEQEPDTENSSKLHALRLVMLERLMQYVPQLKEVGGVRAIPFMQVVLMLTSDLDGEEEKDRACLESLLTAIISELRMKQPDTSNICERNKEREVHLVIMRLLSVLMSRSKSNTKTTGDNSSFVSQTTAAMLLQAGVIDYCLTLLKALLQYWKSSTMEEAGTVIGGALLKPHLTTAPPDMSPFFLRQYVKGHASDVFEAYPQLLTEMALRLPYQVQKQADNAAAIPLTFQQAWYFYLCEYMMTHQTPFVRRQVRKLLLFICCNKDKYRQLRDLHALESHMKCVQTCCRAGGYDPEVQQPHCITLPYDSLVELIEHLKACVEVATSRTGNWQRFCVREDSVLPFLLQVSCLLDEGVSPTILQLLQCAICGNKASSSSSGSQSGAAPGPSSSTTTGNNTGTSTPTPSAAPASTSGSAQTPARKEREKSDDSDTEARFEEAQCITLVTQINKQVSRDLLARFVKTFLLETNATTVRWQAHALVLAIYKNSPTSDQEALLDLLWKLWPQLPAYGRKAAQFVDLLGYFSLKTTQTGRKMCEYMEQAVSVLHTQNQLLAHHPNANLYTHLAQFVELDGYYLESEPCLVCNNPEVALSSIKLSSIKIDSKFTTTTQIVKLVGSHTISKITLRIGDLKRTKMVRTINIYYNNRSVQAVVELKNKPAMWHKAKKVTLATGQTEVKMEFPLPIVACNLMIEYADFYENIQASSETLQCPRCSASVPANPGVCANCGENVFQCHKCRAINYDEKDPFLCHACGFCKYAKFDYTLTGRACCAVDPIESDDDRKKTVATINSLLEKADRVYKQLIANKPTLELLLLKISEHRLDRALEEGVQSGNAAGSTQVNRAIQLLAQRYCGECKSSFEELSKIIQRVLACRRELVAYDRNQRDQSIGGSSSSFSMASLSEPPPIGRCYGCASAATEHCLTLLRALAASAASRQTLCAQGLIAELLDNNLRRGTVQVQEEVRQLLCLLTRDNPKATEDLRSLLMDRIALTLRGHVASSDLAFAVRHEMALLAALVQKEDSCWEQKLRCVMQLFLMACKDSKSPVVMQSIILPCLKILQSLIKPDQPVSKKNKDKTVDALATIKPTEGVRVEVAKWLQGDPKHSYKVWRQHMPARGPDTPASKPLKKEEARAMYLMEKYGHRWRQKSLRGIMPLRLTDAAWLKQVLFNPSSRLARQVACNMLESLCQVPVRKREILDLLTGFLGELGSAGESAAEFLSLYQSLVQPPPWKQYLAVRGVLLHLAELLTREIQELHRLEDTTLTSDLAQGYALKMLTELLASFLEQDSIKQQYKGRLVGAVLNGYLSLRRLVVQRTRLIDDTQEKLLELLEEMTTGTEQETKAFMAICIETVQKYSPQDVRTPVFIFERLCSIIYPEENDVGEFFLTLEKDPQQEDFLQGRMLGNPYSSTEPGLGPLMRDVKNKICQDCELVALLEDDNGMELLVNNKIISLDLPVREVFKKVWVAEGGEGDAMRVVYRMRGLLGDATEEFVETLDAKSEQEVNNEEVYKMANVMADCGGLQIMLDRLSAIKDITRARPLLQVLLKLFRLCVKVQRNQQVLTQPELGAIGIFLGILQLCLAGESDASQAAITEQLLDIMETILSKAASQPLESFLHFSQTFGGSEHIRALLTCTTAQGVRSNSAVLLHLSRVLAALTYGNATKMALLCDHFSSVTDFNRFDFEHTPEDEHKLELLCILTAGIERNAIGNTLKDHIVSLGIVRQALEYITMHAPCVKPTLMRTDSDDWKEFISKPALKYILRFLTGLATEHEPTQLAVSTDCIPIIHRLEQVSSDEHVGSLAENLLEALRAHPTVATLIEEVREQTRAEKKRLAMAMREKQLGALGMRTNEKGQVTAKSTLLMEDLGEETGLVCVICREGYKFQPSKVLGVYTFTKRCNVEEFEAKPRKTVGYSTVTHFNVVHVDCHMAAVRLARARDEWESAALQNANTKCNGLLPLWGPQVPESAFASCLARHNTYLQECTGHRDISYASTVHDLKLLLLRFAQEKSFHDDTGGGGPQSNMHIIPYLIHMALYVINTTRSGPREDKNLTSYLDNAASDKWLESCYEAEGPLYWAVLSLLLHPPSRWNRTRLAHLKRLLVLAQTRHTQPAGPAGPRLSDVAVKEYNVYKSYMVFFGLVDGIYANYFKKVNVSSDDQWPSTLADYIRHNDEALLKASERLLATYREELLPCASFEEFCDVTGLLGDITNPGSYISDVLKGLT
ncbi:E3 ubiquitin-protein ligase UBR4 isoform X2 [Periplaneta americana]|uniref:E3 ubiquitin-protein ligase UBR4 isoform X2 n=1 Tax=Periplaneta americana TaxID=6978 RepID=UPI0037E83F81